MVKKWMNKNKNMDNYSKHELCEASKKLSDMTFLINYKAQKNYTPKLNTITLFTNYRVSDFITYVASKTDFLEEHTFNISTDHKKQTYSIADSFFKNYIEGCNIRAIVVFGSSVEIDMFTSYFSFYKKYNNIKIEYYVSSESYILMYDNPPIEIHIHNIEKNVDLPFTSNISVENVIYFEENELIYNAIKFNITNDIQKFVRKMKLDTISDKL
jgi:hypothetical protein